MANTSLRISTILLSLVAVAAVSAADRVRIVSEGGINKDWAPVGAAPLAKASYPAHEKHRSRNVCINLGYQLNKDGKTSDFSVIRAWSSENPDVDAAADAVDPFVQAAAAAVAKWQFEPTPDAKNNRTVYTSTSMAFIGEAGGDPADVQKRCEVLELRAYIEKLQAEELARGNLERSKMEKYQRENGPAEQAARANAQRQSRL